MYRSLTIAAAVALFAVPAFAEGSCSKAPASQFQPTSALKAKLEKNGMKVRRIKVENGCYEVYGITASGERTVAAYNARTFEKVSNAEAGEN